MGRIKRSTDDPLLRQFYDRYGLHLLAQPRSGVDVGALVITRADAAATATTMGGLVEPPLPPLPIVRDEVMADVRGVLSEAFDLHVGASMCEAFVAALGLIGVGARLEAAGRGGRDARIRFRLDHPQRDSIDPAYLAAVLMQRRLNRDWPLYEAESVYYVVTAVARSRSLEVTLADTRGKTLEADFDVEGLVGVDTAVDVERTEDSWWRFVGEHPVTYGVELFELIFTESGRARLRLPDHTVKVRSGERELAQPQPAVLGGTDAPAFLDLDVADEP
jgi:hypothetical protein